MNENEELQLPTDVVARVMSNPTSTKGDKVLRLLCLTQLEYRQRIGDEAWAALKILVDQDVVNTIAFWTGLMVGGRTESWKETLADLIPESKAA